jgi:hypothetical protein
VNIARALGLVCLLAGVVLQPVGWMYTHWLTAVSFAAIVLGVVLLLSGRHGGSEGGPAGQGGGRGMPGDVHGYSGQMSGGRSTSWESHHSSESGGSSD